MKARVSQSGKNAEVFVLFCFCNLTNLKVLVYDFNFVRKHKEVRRNRM